MVGKLKGLNCSNAKDFIEILQTINCDLRLGLDDGGNYSYVAPMSAKPKPAKVTETLPKTTPQPEQPKKEKPYSVVQQSFSAKELMFWQQFGVTPDVLKNYKVLSLRGFKSENNDRKLFVFYSADDEPIFCFSGKRYVKIYRPF